jgi:hypothetical protein
VGRCGSRRLSPIVHVVDHLLLLLIVLHLLIVEDCPGPAAAERSCVFADGT